MKSLKTYLKEESAEGAFEKVLPYSIYLSGNKKTRFEDAVNLFIAGLKSKSIYNARFKDAYSYGFSRGLEEIWEKIRDEVWDELKSEAADSYWDLYSFSNLNGAKKFLKSWEKYSGKYKKQYAFAWLLPQLNDAVKELKTYVVAGKPKAEPKPGQFVKPMASVEAHKLAAGFLKEAVASFESELKATTEKQFMQDYEVAKKLTLGPEIKKASANVQSVAELVLYNDGYYTDPETKKVYHKFALKDNADDIIKRAIANYVQDIIDGFVGKNTSKLSLIFQKKPEVSEHKIIRSTVRQGMLENIMYFKFPDGSNFRIESQVIYKMSQMGKPFLQYPTRFSDVTMADGTKMKTPSEEKMIKEF